MVWGQLIVSSAPRLRTKIIPWITYQNSVKEVLRWAIRSNNYMGLEVETSLFMRPSFNVSPSSMHISQHGILSPMKWIGTGFFFFCCCNESAIFLNLRNSNEKKKNKTMEPAVTGIEHTSHVPIEQCATHVQIVLGASQSQIMAERFLF